ncbi:MAG: NAD(P)H-hydrate dehydratase [Pontiellaceae bacterium]
MKLVDVETMRMLDRRAIQEEGIPEAVLMQRAGLGIADAVERLALMHQVIDSSILMLAGMGNNGGDVFVAARYLWERDIEVNVRLAGRVSSLKGAAEAAYQFAKEGEVPIESCPDEADWTDAPEADILVDGLLGTGFSGEPRGVMKAALAWADSYAERLLVVAVDLPSAKAVRADVTVALGLPKKESVAADQVDLTGRIEVVDIGIPKRFIEATGEGETELITDSDVAPLLLRRQRNSHKGVYGHLHCIGGSLGMSGAMVLTARAGLRGGAGWVSARVPASVVEGVASCVPEAMVQVGEPVRKADAMVVGPGMGCSSETQQWVLRLLKQAGAPLVLDADGLAVLEEDLEPIRQSKRELVITPHPGEFAGLFGMKVEELQSDREVLAKMAATQLQVVCVLKGARTVVAAPDGRVALNATGNPGMATAGAGDVLAGLIGALLAQGLSSFEAACAGVWLHGQAGDLAAAAGAEISLCAGDIIEKLPEAFRAVSPR